MILSNGFIYKNVDYEVLPAALLKKINTRNI